MVGWLVVEEGLFGIGCRHCLQVPGEAVFGSARTEIEYATVGYCTVNMFLKRV